MRPGMWGTYRIGTLELAAEHARVCRVDPQVLVEERRQELLCLVFLGRYLLLLHLSERCECVCVCVVVLRLIAYLSLTCAKVRSHGSPVTSDLCSSPAAGLVRGGFAAQCLNSGGWYIRGLSHILRGGLGIFPI